MSRWRLAVALVLAAQVTAVGSPIPAWAEPETVCSPATDSGCQYPERQLAPPPEQPALEPLAMTWAELGLPDSITATHSERPQTVTVPIPDGLRPIRLTGQIEAVSAAVNCRVDVFDSEHHYLGPITLAEEQTAGPFTLDLGGAAVDDEQVRLDFHLRQEGPPADLCANEADGSTMKISRLGVEFGGEPANPASVADFLPRFLSRISVRVGSNPSPTVQQAALTLVAHLTRLYRDAPIAIDVDTSVNPAPLPRGPLGTSRAITIREDPNAGISILNPASPDPILVIAGEGEALRRQVELFSDRRFEIAQDDAADVLDSAQFAVRTGTVKTFGELRMVGQTTVSGSETMYLGFDAGEFGVGAIDSAEIHLVAKHSPVIDGSGSVVLRAGQSVIATGVLGRSGTLDLTARIPADAIQSNVGLGLELRYIPPEPGLLSSDGIMFAIQPESTVEVHPGTQTRRGFSVLPMAFVPEFNVAVREPNMIRYAAAAINLMAQHTSVTLRPRLVPVDDAISSARGLLIVTTTDDLAELGLRSPLVGVANDGTSIRGNPEIDVDLDGPLGIVATATDSESRTVLALAANQDWGLVERSLGYIRSSDGQWGSLTGDVVATGAQGNSINLVIDQGDAWKDLHPGDHWSHWATISFGIAVLLLLAGGIVRFMRRRRGRAVPGVVPDVAPDGVPEADPAQ